MTSQPPPASVLTVAFELGHDNQSSPELAPMALRAATGRERNHERTRPTQALLSETQNL